LSQNVVSVIERFRAAIFSPLTGYRSRAVWWLVDDHVCVQKPIPDDNAGWRVSLYPWDHKISFDFFTKEDAVEYAKDVSKLSIDWAATYSAEKFTETKECRSALTWLIALRDLYEADGYFKSRDDEP
jgi:hypothetical protein